MNSDELYYSIPELAGRARTLIDSYICKTAPIRSDYLSAKGKCRVFLKPENTQVSGSFKIRGAASKLLSLQPAEKKRGIIAASSGNHAIACAFMCGRLGINGTLFLPEKVSEKKISRLRSFGMRIETAKGGCEKAEALARKTAYQEKKTYIPPYNDPYIIAGQAVTGMELHEEIPQLDAVFVPVGGGGLISGIACYLKHVIPDIKIIGCQPENSAVMADSVKAGYIVKDNSKPTLADGTAGGIEPESITFALCRNFVDAFIRVSENEISNAMHFLSENDHMRVEGAGALSAAAFLKTACNWEDKTAALILSGGN